MFDTARNKLILNIWEQTVFLFKTYTVNYAPVGCLSITKLICEKLLVARLQMLTKCYKCSVPFSFLH